MKRIQAKIDICIHLIKEFQLSHPKKKYRSDFEVFIKESNLEDFIGEEGETIFVSTIHKAKGKEFNNVFLMLDDYVPDSDEKKREMYVAMTRAKQNLSIHLNGNYLDDISGDSITRIFDDTTYKDPILLVLQLSHKDIWLDFFISRQRLISGFKSGDKIAVNNKGCVDNKGNFVVRFSNGFKEKLVDYENSGFKLKNAEINYIVYWQKEDTDNDVRIILPELKFEKIING